MSPIIPSAVIINILALIFPAVGINVGGPAITTTIQTIILIVTGIVTLVHHNKIVTQAQLGGRSGK